VKKHKTYTETK